MLINDHACMHASIPGRCSNWVFDNFEVSVPSYFHLCDGSGPGARRETYLQGGHIPLGHTYNCTHLLRRQSGKQGGRNDMHAWAERGMMIERNAVVGGRTVAAAGAHTCTQRAG